MITIWKIIGNITMIEIKNKGTLKVSLMGTNKHGIHYKGMMFKSDFDKLNEIGFDVVCVQSDDKGNIIATIKDRHKDR